MISWCDVTSNILNIINNVWYSVRLWRLTSDTAVAIETCICLNSIFWRISELQSQDEHSLCEDWGFDEHATLQPPLPPRKLPNEVQSLYVHYTSILYPPRKLPNEVKSSYVVTPMYWIFMSGTTCTMDSLGLSWATLPRTIRGKLLVTS